VLKVLRKALDEDRTKTFVVEISPLGLVEMTRQNVTDGVREIMTRDCPTCGGEGVIKSEETIAIEVERSLRELVAAEAADGGAPEAYLIRINPRVTAQFIGEGAAMLLDLERETGRHFHFEGSEGLPLDHFAVTMRGTRAEVAERAVPFREGEEAHVQIVEPHMYNVDDAVAKVDGYIISVAGAGRFVGQKRLVRIEEAGRTSATAVLIDLSAEEQAEAERGPAASSSGSSSRGGRGGRGGRGRGSGGANRGDSRRTSGSERQARAAEAEAVATGDPDYAEPTAEEPTEPADPPVRRAADEASEPPETVEGVASEEADAPLTAPDDSSLPDPEA